MPPPRALAARYTDRLRRALARTLPEKASDEDMVRGLAVDAQATLAGDFGRFQAHRGHLDPGRLRGPAVSRTRGRSAEKEPTWSAYGQDAGFIGGRFDFVIWDDLVDPKKQRTIEAKEDLQNYWDDVSEPRLEPSGLLMLQGQRFSSDDLYRYCLDKVVGDEEDRRRQLVIDRRSQVPPHQVQGPLRREVHGQGDPRAGRAGLPRGVSALPRRLPWRELSADQATTGGPVRGGVPAGGHRPVRRSW